ncbi:MAG: hypothetical protein AAGC71_15010 [Pseudomonadota bacterium]
MSNVVTRLMPAPQQIAWFWAGALVGLYLIEFPVRFSAPEIDYAAAIGMGSKLFLRLNMAEWGLLGVMVVFGLIARPRLWVWGVIVVIGGILGYETWVLMPELVERAHIIVGAGSPPPSSAHGIYSSLELVKAAALVAIAIGGVRGVSSGSVGGRRD